MPNQITAQITLIKKEKEVYEASFQLHTPRLAIHLTPATRYPEASQANCKLFRRNFREAEGSAPLDRRAI